MKIERNFNKRSASLVDVQQPHVIHSRGCALGVMVTAFPAERHAQRDEIGALRMHMTPEEAITFGLNLIAAGRDRLKAGGEF